MVEKLLIQMEEDTFVQTSRKLWMQRFDLHLTSIAVCKVEVPILSLREQNKGLMFHGEDPKTCAKREREREISISDCQLGPQSYFGGEAANADGESFQRRQGSAEAQEILPPSQLPKRQNHRLRHTRRCGNQLEIVDGTLGGPTSPKLTQIVTLRLGIPYRGLAFQRHSCSCTLVTALGCRNLRANSKINFRQRGAGPLEERAGFTALRISPHLGRISRVSMRP